MVAYRTILFENYSIPEVFTTLIRHISQQRFSMMDATEAKAAARNFTNGLAGFNTHYVKEILNGESNIGYYATLVYQHNTGHNLHSVQELTEAELKQILHDTVAWLRCLIDTIAPLTERQQEKWMKEIQDTDQGTEGWCYDE